MTPQRAHSSSSWGPNQRTSPNNLYCLETPTERPRRLQSTHIPTTLMHPHPPPSSCLTALQAAVTHRFLSARAPHTTPRHEAGIRTRSSSASFSSHCLVIQTGWQYWRRQLTSYFVLSHIGLIMASSDREQMKSTCRWCNYSSHAGWQEPIQSNSNENTHPKLEKYQIHVPRTCENGNVLTEPGRLFHCIFCMWIRWTEDALKKRRWGHFSFVTQELFSYLEPSRVLQSESDLLLLGRGYEVRLSLEIEPFSEFIRSNFNQLSLPCCSRLNHFYIADIKQLQHISNKRFLSIWI